MKKVLFTTIFVFLFLTSISFAGMEEDLITAISDIEEDYELFSEWTADQLAEIVSFNAASGLVLPADVVSFPGLEVGFNLGASLTEIDTSAFRALSTKTINTDEVEIEERLGLPYFLLHAKLGLGKLLPILDGIDFGIKGGNYSASFGDVEVENEIIGVELRKSLIKDSPTSIGGLTLNLTFDMAEGSIKTIETYKETTSEVYSTIPYTQRIDADASWKTEWNIKSLGLKSIYSKKFVFFTPFAGIGVNRNTGDVESKFLLDGDASLTNGTTEQKSFAFSATDSSKAKTTEWRLMAGMELNLMPLKLNLSGEFSKDSYAGNVGMRFQF